MKQLKMKQKKGLFLGMLLGTLGARLLGNLLTCKWTIRAGEGTFRAHHLPEIKDKAYVINQ